MGRMSLISSDRERRLWLWALAVVVGIYATLGPANTLAGALRASGLLEIAFASGMLLIGVAILLLGLRVRPSGAEIGVAVGVAATYLLVFVRMNLPEERTHLIEYSVVAALIYQALGERAANGRKVPYPALLAWGLTALLGLLDEAIQWALPNRVFDPRDILFNALAGFMAVFASFALARARQWRRGKRQTQEGQPS